MTTGEVHDLFITSGVRCRMPNIEQTYLTNQIEAVVRSTVAARSLKGYQARILAFRLARLIQDELAIMHENAME